MKLLISESQYIRLIESSDILSQFRRYVIEYGIPIKGFKPTMSYSPSLDKLPNKLESWIDKDIISEKIPNIVEMSDGILLGELERLLNIRLSSAVDLFKYMSIKGSPFLHYDSGVFYLIRKVMKPVRNNLDNNILFIRDKVWWGEFIPYMTNINNLSTLNVVDGNLWVGSDLEKFGGLERVNGIITLSSNKVRNIDTLLEVDGFKCYSGEVNSLGSLHTINGDCDIRSIMYSTGDLKIVKGKLSILVDTIGEMDNLEYVGENFTCYSNPGTIPKLRYVGGVLNIKKSSTVELPQLETVGKHILVSKDTDTSIIKGFKDRGFRVRKG